MAFVSDGGLQFIPQIAIQYVYLDFDGELTRYNGEILTVDNVEVKDSALTIERINHIVAELNAKYSNQNVIFVTERPVDTAYSTIYIGKTEAFSSYGNFAGLAETLDKGNQNKSDNAFVMLNSTASNEKIIATISHETDHLLGTLDHGGAGLQAYAAKIIISSGETSTGLDLSNYCVVHAGGVANSTTINQGALDVFSGGVANSTTVNYDGRLYVYSGGTANSTTVTQGGSFYVRSGGVANNTTVNQGGSLWVYSGGTATNIDWTPFKGSIGVENGAYVTSVISALTPAAWQTTLRLTAAVISMFAPAA